MKFVVAAMATLVLSACSTFDHQTSANTDQPMTVAYRSSDWRFCKVGECPQPTPKTILEVRATPAVQPVVKQELRQVTVHFPFGKAKPTKVGEAAIKDAIKHIRPGDTISLAGYTDNIGKKPFNDKLANKRADYVAKRLKELGVTAPIEIQANGNCCYRSGNDTEEGRQANRRVEIFFESQVTTKGKHQ